MHFHKSIYKFSKKAVLLGILLISVSFSTAQEGFELGGHLGVAYYFGDLNTNFNLSKPGYNIGAKFRRNFNERTCLTGSLDYGRVSGSDKNSRNAFYQSRNLDFFSQFMEASVAMEFNFFPYIHGSSDDYYTPYVLVGFSMLRYNPKTKLDGLTYTLRDFGTEGQLPGNEYGLMSASYIFGIGFKWDINRDWSVNVELKGRKLFSDYIDDVSKRYPDFASLEVSRGSEAVALSNRSPDPDFASTQFQRGNGKNNDLVYTLSIGIMKYFGQLHCPAISKTQF